MIWNYKKTPEKVSLFLVLNLGVERSENPLFFGTKNTFFLILILIEITSFLF